MTDTELITFVRFWIGNLPASEMSDSDMLIIITSVREQYPDANDCLLKYQIIKNVLMWLIRSNLQATGATGGSGEIKRRTEKRNDSEITVEWDVGTSGGTSASDGGYQEILDMLEEDPTVIGCSPFDTSNKSATVIIGGVSQSQYDKVASNPDARTGFAMGNLCRSRNRNWR